MIDPDGYRPNVGIVLMREDGRLFWARRVNRDGWQFPQGGMNTDETPLEAMYRELREETGLEPGHVEVLGATPGWLRYRLPPRCVRRGSGRCASARSRSGSCCRCTGQESDLRLDLTEKPEFDSWRWVDFWYPVDNVVTFKREVYVRALHHLAPFARTIAGEAAVSMQDAPRCRRRPCTAATAAEAGNPDSRPRSPERDR